MGYVIKIGEPEAKPSGVPAPRKQEARKAGGSMAAEIEVTPPMLWAGGVVAVVALAAGLWFAFGRGSSGTMSGDFRPIIPGPGAQGMPAGGPPVPGSPGAYGGAVPAPQPGPPGGFPNPGPPGARF